MRYYDSIDLVDAFHLQTILASGHPMGVSMGALVVRPGSNLDWTTAIRETDRLIDVAKHAGTGGFQVEAYERHAMPVDPSADATVLGVDAA